MNSLAHAIPLPTSATSQTPDASTRGQRWNAADYATFGSVVPRMGEAVVEVLDPRASERILDLGCGDGRLTTELVRSGASVVGVDASADMVDAAHARGLDARLMDGHALAFDHEFDAVFSNAALHWMRDPDQVLAGVRRALKPGGRFVAEFGGEGNIATIAAAIRAARAANGHCASGFGWYFPSVQSYRQRLQAHGFQVHDIRSIERPTLLPSGIEGWLNLFANPFLDDLAPAQRQQVLDDAIDIMDDVLRDDAGRWTVDYVRLRVHATAPQ